MRGRLREQGRRLAALLTSHGLAPDGGCAFFQWRRDPDAQALHEALARRGVLTRHFDLPQSLRFGLPGDDAGYARLDLALRQALQEVRA
jgi:cobalamin biosynthetic protein CobC